LFRAACSTSDRAQALHSNRSNENVLLLKWCCRRSDLYSQLLRVGSRLARVMMRLGSTNELLQLLRLLLLL
jgi:hypothetical protein